MVRSELQQPSGNGNNTSYFILDAARIFGKLEMAQKQQADFLNLYGNESEGMLNSVAPYLFPCPSDSTFSKWILDQGWGNSWGVLLDASVTIENLRQHLHKFILVKKESGEAFYFRFYDPRVLKIFLPTCDKDQLIEFFGPVDHFIVEDTQKDAIKFWHQDGILKQQRIPDFINLKEQHA